MILVEGLKGKWTLRIAVQDEVEVRPIIFRLAKRTCRATRLSLDGEVQAWRGQGMRLTVCDDRLGPVAQAQDHIVQLLPRQLLEQPLQEWLAAHGHQRFGSVGA